MSDTVKTILWVGSLTLLVAGIVLATGVSLGLHLGPSVLFAVLGAGVFLHLMLREEEAPPLEMRQSTWHSPEEDIEKED